MAQRHLFPCPHCNQAFSIDTNQAGQNVVCPECKEPCSAPTLRKIRELPLDETQVEEKAASWSFERRSMFAGGLAAFLIGLGITTVFLLLRSQLDTEIPSIPEEEAFLAIPVIFALFLFFLLSVVLHMRTTIAGPAAGPDTLHSCTHSNVLIQT